jgi:hypothetical protein
LLATTGSEEPPQSAPLQAPWCRPLRPRELGIDIQISMPEIAEFIDECWTKPTLKRGNSSESDISSLI